MDLKIIPKLRKILTDLKPDVIHTHLNSLKYVMWSSRGLKSVKRIHTIHTLANKDGGRFDKFYNKLMFRTGKVVPVALSKEVQASIIELYKIPEESVPVIFNGTDLSKCIVKQDYVVTGDFKILHIGRFLNVKNHSMLIKAFKRFNDSYPNSSLSLIGDGETKSEAEALVAELGLTDKVNFLGLQASVYSFLNEADLFTLPSHYEGVPLTLTEAMGTGLPIVATAVGGIVDMLEDGENAMLIEVDENQLVDAFERMYNDADFREKCGKSALEASVMFSHKNTAASYLKVYQM